MRPTMALDHTPEALSAIGPMMRMIFGEHASRRHRDKLGKKASRDEVERLDGAIAGRDAVIEDLQRRLTEMESRLDFAERMLADRKQPAALPLADR